MNGLTLSFEVTLIDTYADKFVFVWVTDFIDKLDNEIDMTSQNQPQWNFLTKLEYWSSINSLEA